MGDFLFAARSGLGFLTTIPVGISMEGLAAFGYRGYWSGSIKTFHGTGQHQVAQRSRMCAMYMCNAVLQIFARLKYKRNEAMARLYKATMQNI